MKIRQEYDQRCRQYKDEILELAGENEQLNRRREEFQAQVREIAAENEQLNQKLAQIPQTPAPSLPVEEIKKALDHHRARSSPDAERGKMLYQLASDIEEVLAGKHFIPKEKKCGRKPKR